MQQWSWQLLRAGSFKLDGGAMFGLVPRTLWSRLVRPDENNRIPLQTNCLLLERGEHRVLIETGFGGKWSDKDRSLYELEHRTVLDALREVSCDPSSISHVIVSHLHFDHAGGLTHLNDSGEPVASFPGATVFAQRTEWLDALANKSTMTRTYLRSHLDPIAERVELVDGESEILPGITVWPMVGHTWGQQAIRFHDVHGVVAFVGDVMPTIHHAGLAFSMGYDMLPYDNMVNKKQLLERAAGEHWRLTLDHEPDHPVVIVQADTSRPGQFLIRPADQP